jgi:hypothetical protein
VNGALARLLGKGGEKDAVEPSEHQELRPAGGAHHDVDVSEAEAVLPDMAKSGGAGEDPKGRV